MLHQACDVSSPLIQMPAGSDPDISSRIGHIRNQLDALQQDLLSPQPDIGRLRQVRLYLVARANARAAFGEAMFSDPAWDMLVQLYAHHLAQQRTTLVGLCTLTNVAPATGQRWIRQLEQAGHIERATDPLDARKHRIQLTSSGRAKMEAYFQSLG